jgi:Domain of unknown function (DUF4394)
MRLDISIRPMHAMLGLSSVIAALTSFSAEGQELIYGYNNNSGVLVSFNSATPGTIKSSLPLTGLASGEQIRAIDWIGSTLFGLGSENHLYTINTTTGAVTPVGPAFSPVLNGVNFGMGLAGSSLTSPLYVASDLGQNLSLNPTTGAATQNPSYTGASLNSIAYNFINGTYIGVSAVTHDLYTISPTAGTETLIGATGVNFLANVGLTVSPTLGEAYFSGTVGSQSGFYDVNTTTGAFTLVGDIGSPGTFTTGFDSITATGIVVPEPASAALFAIGGGLGVLFLRRKK